MEQGDGQPQANAQPSPDKNLLLLGLQLLNKGLRLPCAVVQPRIQTRPSPQREEETEESPQSPEKLEKAPGSRKRKRNLNNDLSETERREKR